MPGIFFRHVLRGILAQTLLLAAVLLAVLVVYQFSFVLGRAADGQIDGTTVPRLVWLSLRTNLGVILPLAVLLGVVSALGRLYYDSEITAALSSGVGVGALHGAAAAVVLPATALAAWVAFVDGPAAARDAVALRLEAIRAAVTRGLEPGHFRPLGEGATLHFEAREADGTLRGVFLQRELAPTADGASRMQVLVAQRAVYRLLPADEAIEVEFRDGASYEGRAGALDWRVLEFGRQVLRVPVPHARLPGPPRTDQLDNATLLAARDPRLIGELHWRIGWVAAVLVLGMLAVPLARLPPRQGRHARVPLAVLLFALQAGLLITGRSWLERGETPAALGLWWVHASVLLLALAGLQAGRVLRVFSARQP